ncbi:MULTISPECIES: helix-turn-helix transcriptional regulator [Microbispora]|uniref:Helix-turn-helix domain-containing protein n=2 Tax=Microbispora TaxID=2005 RepID=A0A940WLR7_9ACTN|nr:MULTISPECIES: helix-turn-helix domain-containing protein [Microbispora]MBP2702909.1 helix-turn-helix domain-containing protein [Microbispora oryzae]GIH50960.1 excisionase [Microbispora rosea subsp. rosea]SIR45781.1 transcriptional regulator, AlpA family [Microbispora rosea]
MRKDDKLMTVPEILDELGVSVRTFYRWREIGKAPQGFKLPNGEIRIYRSEFAAWLESLREAA